MELFCFQWSVSSRKQDLHGIDKRIFLGSLSMTSTVPRIPKTGHAGVDFRYRRSKSDKLQAARPKALFPLAIVR